ncbi:MAG: urease accessory protein UreG [Opitutales bacterium]|jgi:urease accessory protein
MIDKTRKPVVVGIGGPVGSGKSTLCLTLCKMFRESCEMAVITNDIYTREDARMLIANAALPAERIMGVETGGCPHTAIRDDISMNLDAIDELKNRFSHLDVILLESGGDNLTATFSPELVDVFIYVIDVTEGDDIPRKGGPAIEYSDLLLINKVTLAPYVEANTELMESDTKHKRPVKPFYFTDLKAGAGLSDLEKWFRHYVLFTDMDE